MSSGGANSVSGGAVAPSFSQGFLGAVREPTGFTDWGAA